MVLIEFDGVCSRAQSGTITVHLITQSFSSPSWLSHSVMEGRPEEGQSGEPDELGILTRNEAHRPLNILLKSFF